MSQALTLSRHVALIERQEHQEGTQRSPVSEHSDAHGRPGTKVGILAKSPRDCHEKRAELLMLVPEGGGGDTMRHRPSSVVMRALCSDGSVHASASVSTARRTYPSIAHPSAVTRPDPSTCRQRGNTYFSTLERPRVENGPWFGFSWFA
jgi:hypothetical protein